MKLKESVIWIGPELEIMTSLTLTPSNLCWKTLKSSFSIDLQFLIGSIIPVTLSRSFKVLAYDQKLLKFTEYDFSAITAEHAREWCEIITKQTYNSLKRHMCIIINPISGNKTAKKVLEKNFLPVIEYSPHSYDCFYTDGKDYVYELIQRRDFSIYTDIICLGGDGTMQQVINGIYKHQPLLLDRLNFGIVPVGSRNALACELNGKCLNEAIYNAIKTVTLRGDVMKVTISNEEILATTAISWGLISDVTNEAQHLRIFGAQRYNVVALKKFFSKWKQYPGVVSFKDSLGQMISFRSDYIFISVGNHRVPNTNNSEILMPNARINNGKLELLIVFYTGKIKSIAILKQILDHGSHAKNQSVNFIKTNIVKIEPQDLMVFNVDGEIHYDHSITVEVLPLFINYIGRPAK